MALIMFYGTDCPNCNNMKILVDKLQTDFSLHVDMYDVWQSESHYRVMENYIHLYCPDCPGIPFFINTDTNQVICGEVGYKKFSNWALGGRVE